MKRITVALVGQPNVGKSMLINSISGAHLKVGNFTGVTVEKAEVFFERGGYEFRVVDLPGSYALGDYSLDERVTRQFLLNEEYDLILNVADSTNLERNLQLTAELMELDRKMVLALNMRDEAKREGIDLDDVQMGLILGIPCLSVSAATREGIDMLLEMVIGTHENPAPTPKLVYSAPVEEGIETVAAFLRKKGFRKEGMTNRHLALKLLQEDDAVYKKMHDEPVWMELLPVIREQLKPIQEFHETLNLDEAFMEERLAFAKGAASETVKKKLEQQKTLTEKIDQLLIHPVLGIPLFLFFMWSLFQLTFELGAVPMDWIDAGFAWLGDTVGATIGHEGIRSLIVDGVIAGVGAVILFLPNIVILFLGIALLETTGYMARVAFLLDGLFHKFGLHGKSFIPLVTGFGCTVPAYMAARILKNESDRLITLFILGFMSCGARLPVYVLFAGAFFPPEHAGNVLFGIYIAGAFLGLIAAKILRMTAFKGEEEPFVMEMPKYRMPSLRLIWFTVYNKAIMYIKKAGTYILAASVIIWFASNYPKQPELAAAYETRIEAAVSQEAKNDLANERVERQLEGSYLGMIGKATEPLLAPLGFDWRMTVALETGLLAKEVIIATMGVLYSLGDEVDEGSTSLMEMLRENIPLPAAVAFIVFVMIYMPCLAATVVFGKESGKYRYVAYLFLFTTAVAWVASFAAYQITTLLL